MGILSPHTLLWLGRVLYVAVALWWPAVWRDPIYTPRQARMSGQELRLPDGSLPHSDNERAVAIFSAWEHRQLVETRWIVGPYIGLRSSFRSPDQAGLQQTIFAMLAVWFLFGVLIRRSEGAGRQDEIPAASLQGGRHALATTPLWQLFQRLRQQL
jgi:hypothetical protein